MSLRLSVVIITHNAAGLLPGCLASIALADEIVVLDYASEDETLNIALAAGAKIATNNDWQGYGIQRQRAQRLASGDYILMLDADERVSAELMRSIRQVLKNPRENCVYTVSRRNWFLGRFMRHSGWYPDRVVRLYPRHYRYNDKLVHESLVIHQAKVTGLSGDLLHLTCLDFMDFQQKQLDYARAWAKERFLAGKRSGIIRIFTHPLAAFIKTLLLRGGILDGQQGFLLAVVNAQYTFNKYTALWALQQGNVPAQETKP